MLVVDGVDVGFGTSNGSLCLELDFSVISVKWSGVFPVIGLVGRGVDWCRGGQIAWLQLAREYWERNRWV